MRNEHLSSLLMAFLFFNISCLMAGGNPFCVGAFQLQSFRPNQEDRWVHHFFEYQGKQGVIAAVFDGHGGDLVAGSLKNHFIRLFMAYKERRGASIEIALNKTFIKMHNHFEREENKDFFKGGSTAIVTVAVGDQCWFANLGDSRGYLKKSDGFFATEDHCYSTNSKEYDYAVSREAVVTGWEWDSTKNTRILRLNGKLMISRAFGDSECKFMEIDRPDGNGTTTINPMNNDADITWHTMENSSYILLASDGFFDVVTNEEVDGLVNEAIKWSLTPEKFIQRYEDKIKLDSSPDMVPFGETDTKETRVAKLLTYYAVCHKLSGDNTTVVFIQKNKFSWLSNPYVIGALGILVLVLLYRYQMR